MNLGNNNLDTLMNDYGLIPYVDTKDINLAAADVIKTDQGNIVIASFSSESANTIVIKSWAVKLYKNINVGFANESIALANAAEVDGFFSISPKINNTAVNYNFTVSRLFKAANVSNAAPNGGNGLMTFQNNPDAQLFFGKDIFQTLLFSGGNTLNFILGTLTPPAANALPSVPTIGSGNNQIGRASTHIIGYKIPSSKLKELLNANRTN